MKHFLIVSRWFTGSIAAIVFLAVPVSLAYASVSVSIQSLSPSTNISVGTNVSFTVSASGFTSPTYTISDSLSGSSVSTGDINSSGNFSWTPTNSDIGTHNLTITVSDSLGDNAQTEETITVNAAPAVSIQSLSPSTNITGGQSLTFTVAASGFTNPVYSVSDSFTGGSVSSNDISSNGNFSWTPGTNDTGTHNITVNVSDSSGHSISASETITVSAASSPGTTGTGGATIQGLSPGTTVVVGQPVTFTVAASGFSNPVFSASDSFQGGDVSNSDINTAGYFTWTPTNNDVGTHSITIYVNDSSGHSGNVTLSLTVGEPSVTVTSINPGTNVLPNSELTFDVSPMGFTDPNYTVGDSFSGTTISNSDINSSGDFSWTPASNQEGTHTITIYATDSSGHSANTTITVDVSSGTSVSLTAPTPSTSVAAGTAVSFNAYAYGFTSPTLTLQDSFSGSSLTSAEINSSGEFYWIPTANDAGSHTITVTATDAYGHFGSAQVTILVSGSGSTTSGTTLSQLEAELQQDESSIAAAGGTVSGPSTSYVFTTDMSVGMTSDEVTQLQTVLAQQGDFSGTATGYYGSLTETAVEKFQGQHGIDQIGSVGPETRAALNALMVPETTTTTSSSTSATAGDGYVFSNFIGYGDTSNDVTELQKRLTAFDDYSGPITGYFGSLTQTAVEKFQGEHGIDQVGYVGPGTRAALNQ